MSLESKFKFILSERLVVYKHTANKKLTCKPVRLKHKRLVLALVFMLPSPLFTRTTKRRKHKHKRMERFPFSCACVYACVVASYV